MTKEYSPSKKLKIIIEKKIPYSSGMGGGSSNAATAIQGINNLLKLNLDSKEKFDIGLKFGSDIVKPPLSDSSDADNVASTIKPLPK